MYCDISCFYIRACEEALAIRRVFSLVDMITNTKFSNCTFVFKIGAVRQQNMHSKHENTFQSNLSLTKQLKFATVSLSLSHWYPGSGVVLDCIDS